VRQQRGLARLIDRTERLRDDRCQCAVLERRQRERFEVDELRERSSGQRLAGRDDHRCALLLGAAFAM
jgi:hypothetical protein